MPCPDCAALRIKLEEANEKIQQLETEINTRASFPVLLGLTPTQEKILAIMLKREYISREAIDRLLCKGNCRSLPKVHICHLRDKLSPYGIEIESLWGRGYALTPKAKEKLRSFIDKPT